MSSNKNVTHAPASTVQIVTPSGTTVGATVTVTQASTPNVRVWVSTNPLVSIYPWYGTAASIGKPVSVTALPGQAVYTHSTEPTQLSVTIA
jgi:hypothetical protein